MKRTFFIHNGKFYVKKFLTEQEITGIMNIVQTKPILNQFGEEITSLDIDFELDQKGNNRKKIRR